MSSQMLKDAKSLLRGFMICVCAEVGPWRSVKVKIKQRDYYGNMMLKEGKVDALISGLTVKYPTALRPILRIIGTENGLRKAAGMYTLLTKRGPMFFADTTINLDPAVEDIVQIVLNVADTVRRTNIVPKVALLSYSNFGSSNGPDARKMAQASSILRKEYPELIVDGEVQANFALNPELLKESFPFFRFSGSQGQCIHLSKPCCRKYYVQNVTELWCCGSHWSNAYWDSKECSCAAIGSICA